MTDMLAIPLTLLGTRHSHATARNYLKVLRWLDNEPHQLATTQSNPWPERSRHHMEKGLTLLEGAGLITTERTPDGLLIKNPVHGTPTHSLPNAALDAATVFASPPSKAIFSLGAFLEFCITLEDGNTHEFAGDDLLAYTSSKSEYLRPAIPLFLTSRFGRAFTVQQPSGAPLRRGYEDHDSPRKGEPDRTYQISLDWSRLEHTSEEDLYRQVYEGTEHRIAERFTATINNEFDDLYRTASNVISQVTPSQPAQPSKPEGRLSELLRNATDQDPQIQGLYTQAANIAEQTETQAYIAALQSGAAPQPNHHHPLIEAMAHHLQQTAPPRTETRPAPRTRFAHLTPELNALINLVDPHLGTVASVSDPSRWYAIAIQSPHLEGATVRLEQDHDEDYQPTPDKYILTVTTNIPNRYDSWRHHDIRRDLSTVIETAIRKQPGLDLRPTNIEPTFGFITPYGEAANMRVHTNQISNGLLQLFPLGYVLNTLSQRFETILQEELANRTQAYAQVGAQLHQ